MPNTRRRKFSVQNDITGRDTFKLQRGLQNSKPEPNTEAFNAGKNDTSNSSNTKSKTYPNRSRNISTLDIVLEHDSSSSISTVKMVSTTNSCTDKNVTASSSNIDFLCIPNTTDNSSAQSDETLQHERQPKKTDSRLNSITNRDGMPRREKYGRQHRVKVRSPRRRIPTLDAHNKVNEIHTRAMGTSPIDWNVTGRLEMNKIRLIGIDRMSVSKIAMTEAMPTEDERPPEESSHSMEEMCRICHSGESLSTDLGQLIAACSCRGTVGRVHVKCLERWLTESGKSRCELCGTIYSTKRVHRYGVARALVMWILSQNAKQLMVDILGIMLMSPLAVLAAWLSGRTLAGLMTQESHVTPWPLASTFVLACMTLVCYYCWIVSAATRHALGWWIWYRSQYEVRLEQQENED